MYFYCSHPPPLFTLTFYNLHLDLTRGCSQKNINFRSTQPPFTTYARAEPASVLMNDCESGRWVIRMNKNYVEPQQRVETHSYYMMIGASAWFCCVAKIARQIMIFDLVQKCSERNNFKFESENLWTFACQKLRKKLTIALGPSSENSSGGQVFSELGPSRIIDFFLSFQ